jgi:hypothetical protein
MDWQAMACLGAYHGINPGMGWLFAVALGLQQGSVRGMWRALPPIAAGHALSVGVVIATAGLAQLVVPQGSLDSIVGAVLISIGAYRLWRHRHPRYGGMQVGFRDLTLWSFLMASAHGAGFMVLPFLMQSPAPLSAAAAIPAHHGASVSQGIGLSDAMAAAVHTLSYFVVMTCAAWVVYRKLGLGFLRSAWFNMDWAWAAALVVTGLVVLLR